MTTLRMLFAGLLGAVMVITSGPMAAARATPEGALIVICAGDGLETVRLGADGAPVEPAPQCPDCLAAMQGVLAPILNVPAQVGALRPIHASTAPRATGASGQIHRTARGPPLGSPRQTV